MKEAPRVEQRRRERRRFLFETCESDSVNPSNSWLGNPSSSWDDILPHVAMGYRIPKQKSTRFSLYFLLYGRQPLFASTTQHLDENEIDDGPTMVKRLRLDIQKRAADLKQVTPIAIRNMAIS